MKRFVLPGPRFASVNGQTCKLAEENRSVSGRDITIHRSETVRPDPVHCSHRWMNRHANSPKKTAPGQHVMLRYIVRIGEWTCMQMSKKHFSTMFYVYTPNNCSKRRKSLVDRTATMKTQESHFLGWFSSCVNTKEALPWGVGNNCSKRRKAICSVDSRHV